MGDELTVGDYVWVHCWPRGRLPAEITACVISDDRQRRIQVKYLDLPDGSALAMVRHTQIRPMSALDALAWGALPAPDIDLL